MKRTLTVLTLTAAASTALLAATGVANAAANPAGTGQPSQSCQAEPLASYPSGYNSGGFAKAGTVYAGSPGTASATHSPATQAVSQYDVACYQLASR